MSIKLIKNILIYVSCAIVLLANSSFAHALSNEPGSDPSGKSQRYVIEKTPWLDPTACKKAGVVDGDTSCRGVYYPVVNNEAAFAAALLAYIKQEKPTSPMATAEIAGYLVAAGKKYNVNPMLLIAMAYQESQLCTDSGNCKNTLNPWGNLSNTTRKLVKYDSWYDSIYLWAKHVGESHIVGANKTTLALEIPYHCGAPDIYTKNGACDGPGYYQNTINRMDAMIALAGSALACSDSGTESGGTSTAQTEVCPGDVPVNYNTGACVAIPNNPVQTAINCSWPNRRDGDNNYDPFPGYLDLLRSVDKSPPYEGRDCGSFVGAMMRSTGADPDYPKSGTYIQEPYVRRSGKYQIIENIRSTADLLPGDILIVNEGSGVGASGHTYIFVGRQSNGNDSASASYKKRYPGLSKAVLSDDRGKYIVARLKK